MTLSHLAAELQKMQPLETSGFLHYLADHVHEAKLANGTALRDCSDFAAWLRELAGTMSGVLEPSTEVLRVAGNGTSPAVIARVGSRPIADPCPRCGHVHSLDRKECGFPIGAGRICRCE